MVESKNEFGSSAADEIIDGDSSISSACFFFNRNLFEMVTSSKGNEKYYEEHKKRLGSDVIADCSIDYWRIEKYTEKGKEMVRVFNLNHVSINGSIPGFVVSAI